MIQRIQTVYMGAVALLSGVLPFLVPLSTSTDGTVLRATGNVPVLIAFLAGAALAITAIAWFKNRQHQFVLNRLNLIVNLLLLGFFAYRSLIVSGGVEAPEKGIGMLIPVFSIVLLVLANRAIKKDEDLVKSVDRLR